MMTMPAAAHAGVLAWARQFVLTLALGTLASLSSAAVGTDAADIERVVSYSPHQAIQDAELQLPRLRASGDRAGELRALRILVLARTQREETTGLKENAIRGARLARELGDMESLCELINAEANYERLQNRYREALVLHDQAIALAEQNNLPRSKAKIYVDKAVLYDRLGRGSDALAILVQAYAVFEESNDGFWMSNALQGIAGVSNEDKASVEDRAKSIENYRRALALIDPQGYRSPASDLYHNIGLAYYHLEDFAQARQYFERGQALARELQDPVGSAYFDYRLGLLAKEERRYDEALAFIDKAALVFKQNNSISMLFQTYLNRADTLSRQSRKKESIDALGAAKTSLARVDTPAREAKFYERAAEIYARFGDFESAYRQTGLLREADLRRVRAANESLAAELQTRFDVRQKEAENALLRAQQKESDARRLVLFLALILSLVVVGGLAFYLAHQVRQKRRIVSVAMRDDLTGLPNRRGILEFARLQFGARRALDAGFCLAVIDIDHFKSINDAFGHNTGDAVLTAFSQDCQASLRSNDRLGRFGGEEFLLVMPGAELSRACIVFERMREAARALQVMGLPPDRRLSFSMGVAVARGDQDTLEAIIKRADEALYRAKQAGRDRCEVSEQRTEENAGAPSAIPPSAKSAETLRFPGAPPR